MFLANLSMKMITSYFLNKFYQNSHFRQTLFYLTKSDFLQAINEMKNSSSCSKNDIPTCIFKIYKEYLWIPLKKLWTESFLTGKIPQQYKTQIIIPIHKKRTQDQPRKLETNFNHTKSNQNF